MKHDILTPSQYEAGIKDAFRSATKVKIIDVFVFPDYTQFIYASVDAHLSHLHTLDFTQLQWIFEYVPVTTLFPWGVKTTYRRHSSDRVCEIRELHPDQCVTDIGKATGLEAYAVPTITYPNADTFETRAVEGFYLLTNLPCISRTPWGPSKFDENTEETFSKLRAGVNKFFIAGDPVRAEWNSWFEREAPRTNDVAAYLEDHRLQKPLSQYFSLDLKLVPSWLQGSRISLADYEDADVSDRDWAAMAAAIPGPSVHSRFDQHPSEPLLFFNHNNGYLQRFVDYSNNFYTLINDRRNVKALKSILRYVYQHRCPLVRYHLLILTLIYRRKIDERGAHHKVGGSKAELSVRVRDFDRIFFGRRLRMLNGLDREYLEAAGRRSLLLDPNQVIKEFQNNEPPITRHMINDLLQLNAVPMVLFNTSLRLLRNRETLIGDSYLESNKISRPMLDLICDTDVIEICLHGDFAAAVAMLSASYRDYSRIFLPVLRGGIYRLVYIDLRDPAEKSIQYMDPRIDSSLPFAQIQPPANLDDDLDDLRVCVQGLLTESGLCHADEAWTETINIFPKYVEGVKYFEALPAERLNDSGVYVLAAIDFISNDVPCIFFLDNIRHFRDLLAHQILVGKFPI